MSKSNWIDHYGLKAYSMVLDYGLSEGLRERCAQVYTDCGFIRAHSLVLVAEIRCEVGYHQQDEPGIRNSIGPSYNGG